MLIKEENVQEIKWIIAKNIQKLRQEKGMTQLELAEKLNYSDKSISKWERGESLPDIIVLKNLADLFEVPLDYLVEEEHNEKFVRIRKEEVNDKIKRNYYIITATSIFIVGIIATLIFVILVMIFPNTYYPWLCYAYAIPAGLIVWLVFNSLWFNPRSNYMIVSCLVWSVLTALYLTFLLLGFNIWPMFLMGIPAQIVIWIWSRMQGKKKLSDIL